MFATINKQSKRGFKIMANKNTTPVKGGKSGKTRERRGFWSRALQAPKVHETLTNLGVDLAAFEAGYNSTRKARERGEISETHVKALAAFAEHKNLRKLAEAIGKSDITAANLLARGIAAGLVKLA